MSNIYIFVWMVSRCLPGHPSNQAQLLPLTKTGSISVFGLDAFAEIPRAKNDDKFGVSITILLDGTAYVFAQPASTKTLSWVLAFCAAAGNCFFFFFFARFLFRSVSFCDARRSILYAWNMPQQAGKALLKTDYVEDSSVEECLKLAVKVLNKTMDSTTPSPEKMEFTTITRVNGKVIFSVRFFIVFVFIYRSPCHALFFFFFLVFEENSIDGRGVPR